MIPSFLVKKVPKKQNIDRIRGMVGSINTVCESARCPNIGECFSQKTLTFMILGNVCTRACAFCGVEKGTPLPVDPAEMGKIAEAVQKLGLSYVVITSVTRDDLFDGGAEQFCKVIKALKDIEVEVLIPDFMGEPLQKVISARPCIINHNMETIKRLYPLIRPQADYGRSLKILTEAKNAGICTKSGFMVGLGEADDEVFALLGDLKAAACDIVTIGQYLPPSRNHKKAERFVEPETFETYKEYGEEIGIAHVEAGPFVRSSYRAEEIWKKQNACKNCRSTSLPS